jgi:hypothetical protein
MSQDPQEQHESIQKSRRKLVSAFVHAVAAWPIGYWISVAAAEGQDPAGEGFALVVGVFFGIGIALIAMVKSARHLVPNWRALGVGYRLMGLMPFLNPIVAGGLLVESGLA